jgi:hypothetical protein
MTQIQATSEEMKSGPVGRLLAFVYGFVSYAIFLGSFLYAIGFVSGLAVPKTIDTGPVVPMPQALIVDIILMSVFAIQHSVMARRQFKQWWTQFVPKPVERSTYVLFASLALVLLFWQWRPIPAVVWEITNPPIAMAILGLSLIGWLIVLTGHVPDQPLRIVRAASGRQQSDRPSDAGTALPHAAFLQLRAASDLSRFHHRILGRRYHDDRASAVRGGDHGLHFRRHTAGRARFGRALRR